MREIITEAHVEENVLGILQNLGYKIIQGGSEDYLQNGSKALREDYGEVVLETNLRESLKKINSSIPQDAIEEAIKQVQRIDSQHPITGNKIFHKMLVDGIDVPIKSDKGIIYDKVWLYDFAEPQNNEFSAVNQFTVVENNNKRRLDVILFVNGIPLMVMELKNIAAENATISSAYNQLQTYQEQIPSLFRFNEILIISDGLQTKAGTITSKKERFMKWRTIDGEELEEGLIEMEVLLRGMCDKQRFLDIIRNFIVFEDEKMPQKKLAAYHQYWAANKAVKSTIEARRNNKKAGIVWHTQGSGKSLTMIFYVGKLVKELDNPTIVVLTDRNDLDDQLFRTFIRCQDILRQKPTKANSRKELQEKLKVSSGGIVFTTIQKFFPEEDRKQYPLLSERDNIVVIADEAHRSQYGFDARIIVKENESITAYGYAKYLRDALPNASFIGFTGTPIETSDRSTPNVFGEYIDVYDIEQAVDDGATVPIYYENRLARLELKPEERPSLDDKFDQVTESEEIKIDDKERLKQKWARMEKIVGSPERIKRIAQDIVDHFEKRTTILKGKAMIVCMSRRICVSLHDEIRELRPNWYSRDDSKGKIKIVMTGSASDPKEWQEHIRNRIRRNGIGDNFKDPDHELELLIVRDMFLTGYDAPSLHTMYLDKLMQGHTLMQAIARVNRVYPDKNGGIIVDYLGVGAELQKALNDYTKSGGRGKPTLDQADAVKKMQEKYEVVRDMFHGFDYKKFFELEPGKRISLIHNAMDHILKENKERFIKETTLLLRIFALAVPDEEAMKIRDEIGFFQAVKSSIVKLTRTDTNGTQEGIDIAIKQIISDAVISDRIIDIFAAAGIPNPELSVLSDEFLSKAKKMSQKNLALEALKRLLNDQIRIISKRNIVQGNSFMDLLDKTIKKYTNRSIEAAQVIEELIRLAKEIRNERSRGKKLELTDDELAFYDALGVNDSAVQVLGNETLKEIALELTEMIRNSVTIDWTQKESVRADIRLKVKKILKKYGYPPDKAKKAIQTVLEQAEHTAGSWAEK